MKMQKVIRLNPVRQKKWQPCTVLQHLLFKQQLMVQFMRLKDYKKLLGNSPQQLFHLFRHYIVWPNKLENLLNQQWRMHTPKISLRLLSQSLIKNTKIMIMKLHHHKTPQMQNQQKNNKPRHFKMYNLEVITIDHNLQRFQF